MDTPVFDFARRYAKSGTTRAHMPGHKGVGPLGIEPLDLTEFSGADSLYEDDGILLQSEQNASQLFGSGVSLYSAEGSSLCIRTMLYLACLGDPHAREPDHYILAARNAHKVFIQTCALLNLDVGWLWDEADSFNLCRTIVSPKTLDKVLSDTSHLPIAVYVTSPDYLGNENDIQGLARVAHKYGVPLLVDNAHGAYLRFLPESRHPLDLGADMCCDSAHKTFPCLTGAAYLHISKNAPTEFKTLAKQAMSMFGSTSPSYLILESLDANNLYLDGPYRGELQKCIARVEELKKNLEKSGWDILPSDELKLTLLPRSKGYTGTELASLLEQQNIMCEYADPDNTVLMLTPQNSEQDFARIKKALSQIPGREPLEEAELRLPRPETFCTLRHAMYAQRECIPVEEAAGRVLAAATMSCPPAVPAVVCGEVISQEAVDILKYYGTDQVWVLKQRDLSGAE